MGATWPIVLAALTGGVIAGALLPAGKQPAKVNLPASSGITGNAATDKKAVTKSADAQDGLAAKIPRFQPEEKRENKAAGACRQESWPYHSHACFDDAARVNAPVQVIRTRRSDPAVAMSLDGIEKEKAQAAAGSPAPRAQAKPETGPPSPRRTAGTAETRTNPTYDERTSEQSQAEQTLNPRPRNRTRQAELPDDWDEDSPRVIIQRDGRRIYVYPNAREERWIAPRRWRDW